MILGAMEERSKKIAHGLAAAEKGQQALAGARQCRRHHARGARARQPDHRSGAASRQRARRAGQGHRQQPRAQRLVAAAQQQIELEAHACAREPAQGSRRASRSSAARSCSSARSTRSAHADLHRQARDADLTHMADKHHHRPTLRPRRVRGGAGRQAPADPGRESLHGAAASSCRMRASQRLLGNPHVTPGAARRSSSSTSPAPRARTSTAATSCRRSRRTGVSPTCPRSRRCSMS